MNIINILMNSILSVKNATTVHAQSSVVRYFNLHICKLLRLKALTILWKCMCFFKVRKLFLALLTEQFFGVKTLIIMFILKSCSKNKKK